MPGPYLSNEKKTLTELIQTKIDYDTRMSHDLNKSYLGKFKVIIKIFIIVWSNFYLSYEDEILAVSYDFDKKYVGQSVRLLEEKKKHYPCLDHIL